MNWIKEKIKKVKTWIIILIIGGVALAAGTTLLPVKDSVLATYIDGQQINIEYTDNNTNESLIIRTDKDEYMNLAGNIGLYFSIYNSAKNDQNVDIVFSFAKDYQLKIWEYDGEETITFPETHPAMKATATTTATSEYTIYQDLIQTKWKSIPSENFSQKTITRKDIKGMKSLKENSTFIKSGETKFFKANIKYLTKGKEEFFIEAFGNNTYGHLDPWTLEDKFNSDTKTFGHLLDGQDGWLSTNGVHIVNTFYEGDQGVELLGSGGWAWADYNWTSGSGIVSGTTYTALRPTETNKLIYIEFYDKPNYYQFSVQFLANASVVFGSDLDSKTLLASYSANTWYVIAVQFDCTAHTAKAKIHNGTSWSDWTADVALDNSMVEVDLFEFASNANPITFYFDTVTPTDPTPPPPAPSQENISLFEE